MDADTLTYALLHAAESADSPEHAAAAWRKLTGAEEEPARMSLDEADASSRLLDALIEQGAPAAIAVSDEVRRRVEELAKKKYPRPN